MNVNFLVYPKVNSFFILAKNNKFRFFYNNIYNYILVNNYNINSNILFKIYNNSLKGLGHNVSRFFKYYYINYCYTLGYNRININFLRERISKKTKGSNLMGYKMYLMGRFTRKQRAGHL
jgi:hypothetical protein